MHHKTTPSIAPQHAAGWACFILLLLAGGWGCMRTPVESEATPRDLLQEQAAQQPNTSNAAEPTTPTAMQQGEAAEQDDAGHPFQRRVPIPEFPRESEWVNTGGPIQLHDLRGRFVLLDFWTYCCINCMHVLPELEKLEETYPNNLVVIGVHAAKFETEEDTENIREAILRYEIEHPVVNDGQHVIWDSLGISAWPTILLIDPEGKAVYMDRGEFKAESVDAIIRRALPYYRERGLLDETPLQLDLLTAAQPERPLRFPGKVLADAPSDRLFIADTGHHRIVVASLGGELQAVVGDGETGFVDGDFAEARFNDPHGMALVGNALYVADTGNHAIRRIDFGTGRVETVAGTGEKGDGLWPGEEPGVDANGPDEWEAPALETELSSPWALWPVGDDLYIGMAGRHQIWRLRLGSAMVGLYAGNGREDIVDGPPTPLRRYQMGYASFAQPSGIASDGERLFIADSEGSSIRVVHLAEQGRVSTLVGTAHLPFNRLFSFGDSDGPPGTAEFQHPLGVAWNEGVVYVADTYNDSIRVVDAESGQVETLSLTAAGDEELQATLDEPEGVSYAEGVLYVADTNRHRIARIDLTGQAHEVSTVQISGLEPPEKVPAARRPDFGDAVELDAGEISLAANGETQLAVGLVLPEGWKLNSLGPMAYFLEASGPEGPIEGDGLGELVRLESPAEKFAVSVPQSAVNATQIKLSLRYYYCQEGAEGLCRAGAVSWVMQLAAGQSGEEIIMPLEYFVPIE